MIADELKNFRKYQDCIPDIEMILSYLDRNNIRDFESGKYLIKGESIFLLIQDYQTKPESEKYWESHAKYIDIQIVLTGREYMGYCPMGKLTLHEPYNQEQDYALYKNTPENFSRLFVQENQFCVFYPEDAHKPGIHFSESNYVKKAVIKVLV